MLKKKKASTDSGTIKFKRGHTDTVHSLTSGKRDSRGGTRLSSSGLRQQTSGHQQRSFKNGKYHHFKNQIIVVKLSLFQKHYQSFCNFYQSHRYSIKTSSC